MEKIAFFFSVKEASLLLSVSVPQLFLLRSAGTHLTY